VKIYIASSWKNESLVFKAKERLTEHGHEVDAFVDASSGRYVFHFSEIGNIDELNAMNFLEDERTMKAFKEDKKWLDWCDTCLLLLPAGKSSHLEAGYAVGIGKRLIIYQDWYPDGEFDVMYGFSDLITDNFHEVMGFLA